MQALRCDDSDDSGLMASACGRIVNACFNHSGQLIASGTESGRVAVWETISGQLVTVLANNIFRVTSVLFSPCGKFIVAGTSGSSASLWDVATGEEMQRYSHSGPVNVMAFSRDGKRLLTCAEFDWGEMAESAFVWDVASGRELLQIEGQRFADFHPNGHIILTISQKGEVLLWDSYSGAELARIGEKLARIRDASFGDEGNMLLLVFDDGGALVVDVRSDTAFCGDRAVYLSGALGFGIGEQSESDKQDLLLSSAPLDVYEAYRRMVISHRTQNMKKSEATAEADAIEKEILRVSHALRGII